MRRNSLSLILCVAIGLFLTGCLGDQPTGVQNVSAPIGDEVQKRGADADRVPGQLPPADEFVVGIDNPYLAFAPRKVFRYEGETADGLETIVVEVTRRTKRILGVVTTVVHDQAFLDGELIEDTFDWFAQDEDGNVWYFGEDSRQIEDGQVIGTEGSWEAGVDGAEPGIIMLANPEVGDRYQQENAAGVAEDRAQVIGLDASVEVEFGSFSGVLETLETTPLDPGAREFKFYEPGVGLLLEATKKDGGGERVELVAIEP